VSSTELETLINTNAPLLSVGSIERLFGVKERRFAKPDEQVSDMGANAAMRLVEKHGRANIDCLIFAAACSDLIEPATANIVQQKLTLDCPAFDIKNACNSFVTALQVASSFVQGGVYKKILITSAEKLSNSILFDLQNTDDVRNRLASLSFGDGGSAVMVEGSSNGCGIYSQNFKTVGKHWELCTIRGGGSMHPFDPGKNYFEGKTSELAGILITEGRDFISACLDQQGWTLHDIDLVFTHQVSAKTFEVIAAQTGFPSEKIIQVCNLYGNVASVSIPLSLYIAQQNGILKHGHKIAIIGLAAGISISVQMMIWK
jgi:3-oxoacyl-[acyl-carrier-protein] synthase-3